MSIFKNCKGGRKEGGNEGRGEQVVVLFVLVVFVVLAHDVSSPLLY